MKKSKIIGLSLGLIAATAISISMPLIVTSCSSSINDGQIINDSLRQTFSDFLSQNHGRWAGNASKYGIENLVKADIQYTPTSNNSNNTSYDVYTGIKSNSQPKYNLETQIDKNINNYGSYHSYLWIVNELKSFGFDKFDEKELTYPSAATIDVKTDSITPSLASNTVWGKAVNEQNTTINDQSIILNSTSNNANFLKENGSILVQSFLWNGRDRASGINYTYNNEAQNIIATISPENATKDFYIVAHYDSTATGKNKASWGATDNATGVSVALAVAEYFIQNKNDLGDVRLHVIFSDAEEVGVYGTKAFVSEFMLNSKALDPAQAVGIINLDTVAGGDYIYAHSPNTSSSLGSVFGNTDKTIRDQLNALSRIRAENLNDSSLELLIHPQVDMEEYRPGETGDWSDHMPFYKYVNIPVAYMESTNFQIKSNSSLYDGYSQTTNLNAYILNDGTSLADKNITLKKTSIKNSDLTVYDLPSMDGYNDYNDYEVTGNIWHYDIDTLDWVNKYIGYELYKQLTTMFESLKLFLKTSI